jgi:MoxR-like ATPase
MSPDSVLEEWRGRALELERELAHAILGQTRVIRLITLGLFARGHLLLEGDVGVGKTTILRAVARGLGGGYARIEGTIDLMPNDLIYYTYIDRDGRPRVDPGPVISHGENLSVFFFNEINRARPQVQALLLRIMAERSASAFNRQYSMPHLTVFADRNRVEREETFEIAAAARDRFLMEIAVEAPSDAEQRRALALDPVFHDVDRLIERVAPAVLPFAQLNEIGAQVQNHVQVSPTLADYALELCGATHAPQRYDLKLEGVDLDRLVLAGVSPRGSSMLLRAARVAAWLNGRSYVLPEDVQQIAIETLAHRVFFNPVYELRRANLSRTLIQQLLARIAAP